MTAMSVGGAITRHPPLYSRAILAISLGVFFTAYLSWRPFEQLFTLSDFLFCIGLVLITAAGRLPLAPFGLLTGPWYLCFSLMLGGLLVSSFINGEPERWLVVALQYSFAMLILPMLLVQHERSILQRLALALILGVAAMQLFGAIIYMLHAGDPLTAQARFGHQFVTGAGRLGAFLGDANWNGAIIAMTLPFAVHLMISQRLPLAPGLLLVALLGLGLVLAASFTGFTSGLLSLLIYAVVGRSYPSWRVLALGLVALAIYVASGAPLPAAFSRRVAPALANQNIAEAGTFVGRWELMEEAWVIAGDTSILGLGVDQFRVQSLHGAPVHNMFLLVWTEGGLPALIGWLGLLTILVAIAVVAIRFDRRAAGLSLAVTTVFLIQATASPHMYARLWFVPVMLAAGFAMLAVRSSPLLQDRGLKGLAANRPTISGHLPKEATP